MTTLRSIMPPIPRHPDKWFAFPHTPLLYRNPVPITPETHGKMSVRPCGAAISRGTAFIPIALSEFNEVSHSLPIIFDECGGPYAAVGIRQHENLFVNEEGNWTGSSCLPGYLRRYPFIHYIHPDTGKFVLCVDMNPQVIVESDENPLFDTEQNPTAYLEEAIQFCKTYGEEEERTKEFGAALAANHLLERRALCVDEDDPKEFDLIWILDGPDFFNEVADDIFLEWRRRDWLAPIYAHLSSQAHWGRLRTLFAERHSQ